MRDAKRPGDETGAPANRWLANTNSVLLSVEDTKHRCAVCHHVITSDVSIEAGIGYNCRRALRQSVTR